MRVYTRETFLALPAGVIFSKGVKWAWGGLCVKGDTIYLNGGTHDFSVLEIIDIDSNDSGDRLDRLDRLEYMLAEGVSYPVNATYDRDGSFDLDDLFLVFEPADLLGLMVLVAEAMEISRPGNCYPFGVR